MASSRGRGIGLRSFHTLTGFGIAGGADDNELSTGQARTNFPEPSTHRSRIYVARFQTAFAHQPYDRLTVLLADCIRWNPNTRWGGRLHFTGRRLRLHKIDARAHLGQDARVAIRDVDFHLHGGVLTIGRRHDLAHGTTETRIGIGVERDARFLIPLHAGDVRFVHI